ncbi:hypothetical protein PA27867_3009 [Cryobacterium arcticum]|uniref:Tfp pilus assembly protein PilO n=1 Tax=Cryobacterium arcticum TaxID=670052 RepID=A0A1B1BN27_9MICO|nr:hypothetical protein PA27867_3009 [Cryobacterium arcticum]
MDKNRMWTIGSIIVMVAVLVGGALLGIQPQLTAAAVANAQRMSVEASNAGQASVLDQLKKDFAGIGDLKAELAPLSASVPNGSMMPEFIDQINALAASTQVSLDGITVAEATPYASVEAPAAVVDPSAVSATSPATPAPTATDTVAPRAGVPPVTNAKISGDNFASLAMTVTVIGPYGNTLNFVNGLQSGQRLFLVSGLTTTAKDVPEGEASTGEVTAVISGLTYALVTPQTAEAPTPAG